ncbi:YtxH domain-containing protein [Photobacterium damselae]|uniref:YtxH domain-containing protein n=1 Tax=Photobacterium damselae TaxID=38293 RepID=UPI0012478FE2|nr:YtxH domain-containing protein [Photobacterium damselae]KAB1181765.1 YtxH domain-containing protein [Photobacterium damselae subsp. damselae]MBF7100481.1 YtxH domain-containing protein [Photobacterium damselae]
MNNNPFYGYPYYGNQQPNQVVDTPVEQPYKKQNSKTHFMMGLAAGAAVAYLLTNKKFQQGVANTGEKAWSAVRGEVEELKERLEDTQAELEYYRNLHKGE